MGWKQWAAVVVVIGAGIVLQIPDHGDALMDHQAMGDADMTQASDVQGPFTRVALNVTGMT